MSIINNFLISFFYKKVGEDNFYNRYYESAKGNYLGQKKRFVVYKKQNDPSIIPPMWHAWLHHLIKEVPNKINDLSCQKKHISINSSKSKNFKYTSWKP